ncbi:MAG: DNA adenine methylase [Propionibacteriaceae bacterium]|nr:DNA adenine methylase [Propionibacteriaceae bacterium]
MTEPLPLAQQALAGRPGLSEARPALVRPRLRLVGEPTEPPVLDGIRGTLPLDSLSPLRYPGSKRKLIPAIRQIIQANYDKVDLFVEPFCGGSSVSLGLLALGIVEHTLIADYDPLIAAFWKQAATDPEALIQLMNRQEVTLAQWDRWRNMQPETLHNRAMKCLFLNRTTFSGIIGGTAGPIGGRAQTSDYAIDCRFNKKQLAKRIRNIGKLRDEGKLLMPVEGTWQDTLRIAKDHVVELGATSVLIYLDPPYVEKAHHLYDRPFNEAGHKLLADSLLGEARDWILSYDREPLALGLYRDYSDIHQYSVVHHYTVKGQRDEPVPGREVLFTNLPTTPAGAIWLQDDDRSTNT